MFLGRFWRRMVGIIMICYFCEEESEFKNWQLVINVSTQQVVGWIHYYSCINCLNDALSVDILDLHKKQNDLFQKPSWQGYYFWLRCLMCDKNMILEKQRPKEEIIYDGRVLLKWCTDCWNKETVFK